MTFRKIIVSKVR